MSKSGATADLARLAAVAQRALAADALLIATRSGGGAPSWPGAAGVSSEELEAIGRALAPMESDFDHTPIIRAASLRRSDLPYADVLVRHGFQSALCAAVRLDGEHAGEIYALRRSEGSFDDEELILVFARHAAVTVAHRRLQRHTAALAGRLESREALDQLVLSADNFSELSQMLSLKVAPLFGAAMTGLMFWDEQREVLQLVAGSFGASEQVAASFQISTDDAHSNAARVFATGRPFFSNDTRGDPGILQNWVEAFGIERVLTLALRLGDQNIGVLLLANKDPGFTVDDLQRAEMLASRIATVVELARTVFRLRRQQSLEAILFRLAVAIASGESIHDFLRPALQELCGPTEASVIALIIEDSPPFVARRDGHHAELEAQILAHARQQDRASSSVGEPRHPGDPGWAALHVPVWLGSQRVGSVAALRLRANRFGQDEHQALERLASLAALAYASERYQQQRAELARREERDRIADDLHDDVAQILFGVQLALDATLEQDDLAPAAADNLVRARGLLASGDAAIRTVISQLSRPAVSDLPSRLSSVVGSVEQAYGQPIHLQMTDAATTAAKTVSEPVAVSLLKVAREALVNAAKHAGPCRALVSLDVASQDRLRLTVVDDGIGVSEDHDRERHGLASLRRSVEGQGGTLNVRARSTGGSKVTAVVPL